MKNKKNIILYVLTNEKNAGVIFFVTFLLHLLLLVITFSRNYVLHPFLLSVGWILFVKTKLFPLQNLFEIISPEPKRIQRNRALNLIWCCRWTFFSRIYGRNVSFYIFFISWNLLCKNIKKLDLDLALQQCPTVAVLYCERNFSTFYVIN